MTLPKSNHKAKITFEYNQKRILAALPANQQELQEKVHLSSSGISRHIKALKFEGLIYISAYNLPKGREKGGGPLLETYSFGHREDIDRPPHKQEKRRLKRIQSKKVESIALVPTVPKLDPLSVMYARNESENISGTSSNN